MLALSVLVKTAQTQNGKCQTAKLQKHQTDVLKQKNAKLQNTIHSIKHATISKSCKMFGKTIVD